MPGQLALAGTRVNKAVWNNGVMTKFCQCQDAFNVADNIAYGLKSKVGVEVRHDLKRTRLRVVRTSDDAHPSRHINSGMECNHTINIRICSQNSDAIEAVHQDKYNVMLTLV